jgi:hypothetical protein
LKDPIVETVFTQYIRDSIVTKSVYEKEKNATTKLVDGLKSEVANLRSQVQSFNSKKRGGANKQDKKDGD